MAVCSLVCVQRDPYFYIPDPGHFVQTTCTSPFSVLLTVERYCENDNGALRTRKLVSFIAGLVSPPTWDKSVNHVVKRDMGRASSSVL